MILVLLLQYFFMKKQKNTECDSIYSIHKVEFWTKPVLIINSFIIIHFMRNMADDFFVAFYFHIQHLLWEVHIDKQGIDCA